MKNKVGKLLCLLIISFFIIGFGGEKVRALQVTSAGELAYRKFAVYPYKTYFQWIKSGNNDVFCLNASKNFTSANYPEVSELVPANKANGVIKIIDAGSRLNLNNGLKYYLTQAAVWYYLNGHGQDGITTGFKSWIESNYPTEWRILVSKMNNEELKPVSISILGSDHKLTEEENGEGTTYLISNDFKMVAENIIDNAVVSIDSGSTEDACILYNGECKTSVAIASNGTFKIRVPKPSDSSGTVSVDFTARAKGKVNTLYTYGGVDFVGAKWQNLAKVTTDEKEVSDKLNVSGEYVNSTEVQLQKIDAESQKKVAGAVVKVYKSNGAVVGRYTTKGEGEDNISVSLPAGDYYIQEWKAPEGYVLNDEKVEFSIVNDSGDLKVKQGGKIVNAATIVLENKELKISFKKVDMNGNPISGLKFMILANTAAVKYKVGDPVKPGLCAITDANGELTQPCSDDDYADGFLASPNDVGVDGVYVLGKDFGSSSDLYEIKEFAVNDSMNKGDSTKVSTGYMGYDIQEFNESSINKFGVSDNGEVISFNPYIEVDDSDTSEFPTVKVIMKNQSYIDISKTDITTGKEIAGATLVVTDKSVLAGQDNVIAEWESKADESERIGGIEFNKRYTITETINPEGYLKMSTSLDFEMNEKGEVKVFDPETGKEITDLAHSDYKLLIPNDYTKVQISKTDMVGSKELPGAELKICTATEYDKDGINCNYSKPEWFWRSEEEAHYIEKLEPGTYYLIETIAPEGYVRKTSAQEFEVKAESGEQKVVMVNEPTKVTISKKDITGDNELPGAHLQILNADTREVAYTIDGVKLEWVSGDKPYEIYGLPAGEYILVETIPPENYAEGMIINGEVVNEFRFTIGENDADINIDFLIEVLNAPNTGMSTLNIFAIGSLMVFIGYEIIKMYRRKAILK